MNFDVKNMSLADLHKLEKEIAKEKKNREGITYKSELEVSFKLADSLKQKLIDAGVEYKEPEEGDTSSVCEVWHILSSMSSNVFKICDITLGNYVISPSGKYSFRKKKTLEAVDSPLANTIRCNGSTIGYTVDTKKYEAMVNDICEIVKKYSEGSVDN